MKSAISLNPSNQTIEEHAEWRLWIVRKITGIKFQINLIAVQVVIRLIPMATPHTVAWMEGDEDGRRHWHNACWAKRNNRRPNRTERTRNAPRF